MQYKPHAQPYHQLWRAFLPLPKPCIAAAVARAARLFACPGSVRRLLEGILTVRSTRLLLQGE